VESWQASDDYTGEQMNSRTFIFLLIVSILIGTASAIPPLPAEFYGDVTIDGIGASPGTVIVAKVNYNDRGTFTLTEYGVYGNTGISGSRLVVQATEEDMSSSTQTITFWINNQMATQETQFESGTSKQLDLTFPGSGTSGQTPVASGESSFGAGGIATTNIGDNQQVTINLQDTNANVTAEGNSITMQNVGSGWNEVIIRTDGTPTIGAQSVAGIVSGITAKTTPLKAAIDDMVGNADAEIEVELGRLPSSDAKLITTITAEPDTNARSGFLLTAQQSGNGILDVAYVLNVQKTNVSNAGDGGLIQSAMIRMAVSPAWVNAMGGVDRVVIMRWADDGSTTSLATTMIGINSDGYLIFEALSPSGLSSFALLGLSVSGGGSTSGSGGGKSSTPSSSFVYETRPITVAPTVPASTQEPIALQPTQTLVPGIEPEQTTVAETTEKPWSPLSLPVSPLIPVLALGLLFIMRRR
jgi:hypothetical protein